MSGDLFVTVTGTMAENDLSRFPEEGSARIGAPSLRTLLLNFYQLQLRLHIWESKQNYLSAVAVGVAFATVLSFEPHVRTRFLSNLILISFLTIKS